MNPVRFLIGVAVVLLCASCGSLAPDTASTGGVTPAATPGAASAVRMAAADLPESTAQIEILEMVVPPPRPLPNSEILRERQKQQEAQRKELSKERAAQQQAARKKAEEKMAKARLEAGVEALDESVAFNRRIDRVDRLLTEEKFHEAIRALDQAMTLKPQDLPVPERVRILETRLKALSVPVEVTLKSDGETYVSIAALLPPQKFYTARVKLMPGDYEVKGVRQDRADVTIKLRVRNGEPSPAVVSVICN